MRYVPFRPARLQVRTRRAACDTRRYLSTSLAIDNDNPPPWHRGFVAVGNIVMALALAWLLHRPSAACPACSFALLYTLSDAEGARCRCDSMRSRGRRSSWTAGRSRRRCSKVDRSRSSDSSA